MSTGRRSQFLLLGPLAVLAGCNHEPSRESPQPESAATTVRVVEVMEAEIPAIYEASGTVRARTAAVISSKAMGYVREVHARAGQTVEAGQLLVLLDARDLDAQVRQAEQARNEVQHAATEVDSSIQAAKANLELAEVTFRRMEELFKKKSVSHQEYDEANARLKAAKAAYAIAESKRAQFEARSGQAEEGLRSATILRDYSKIVAPFRGLITERLVEPGVLASPGAPLLRLEQQGGHRLEVEVEESLLRKLGIGDAANVTIDALGADLKARISEIVPSIDPAARVFTVKLDLPALPRLRSGLFGRAQFSMESRKALLIPAQAYRERGQLQWVLIADGGKAQSRMVTIGRRQGEQVEVLSGLSAGEKVIFPIPANLAEGAPVEVRP
jgi:membrane fusion protein, multidrug efflux system